MNNKKSLLTTTLSTIALVASSHHAGSASENTKEVSIKAGNSSDEREFASLANKHENVHLLHSRIGNNGV